MKITNLKYCLALLLLFMSGSILNAQLPEKQENHFRIAVLGCHKQFEPAPALTNYLETDPDLMIWIGDNVYADAPEDPNFIQVCYDALGAKPAFKQLMAEYDYMATWDDHDFGLNDAGKSYPFKKESKAMFRKFWNLESTIPQEQDGIYYARTFKKDQHQIQVIMLDVRYNRDEPDGTGDVLGEKQWAWLANQLEQPADLRLIASGFQILLDKNAGSETWDNFPKAQQRLFDLIKKQTAEKVIFLTGDQHYGEVCRLRGALNYDAIELQFAGINQIEKAEFNPLRVAPIIKSKHSVAVIDIQMDRTKREVPHLLFQIADAMTNKTELLYRVNLSEIQLHLEMTKQPAFADQHTIELEHTYPGLHMRYTTDGTTPTASSSMYETPFTISKTTTVKARLFNTANEPQSKVFSKSYEKLKPLSALAAPKELENGLAYRYYEGNFTQLPDFEQLSTLKTGLAKNFDLEKLATREDHYAMVFEGLIKIPKNGVYEFYLISDDGSKLFIHDKEVVDNDGSHSKRLRKGLIALEAGYHPIRIEYFEDYSGQTLSLGYTTEDNQMVKVTSEMLFKKD